jgi:hypothetical protein
MRFHFRPCLAALFLVALLSGCASFQSTTSFGDFVKPTDMSSLKCFRYEHTMVSGMVDRRSSQALVMKELSENVLTQELSQRGYASAGQEATFFVVSKWRKEINLSAAEAVRFSLIVELYDTANKSLFWRAELPYIFNASQWSANRVSQTLRLAIQDFPDYITKTSELPTFD